MAKETILVTGSTGNICSLVIPQLMAKGFSVRALVHNKEKAGPLSDKGAEAIIGDLADPSSLERAFDGVSTVFLLTPFGEKAHDLARNAIAAAQKAEKPYIVRLSVIKAGLDAPTANTRSHGQTEKDLKDSGLPVAYLRPHYFMQNIFGSAESMMKDGLLYQGMGDAKLAMIDVRDIADAAAAVLADRGHAGKTYTLTGPASISWPSFIWLAAMSRKLTALAANAALMRPTMVSRSCPSRSCTR